MSRWFTGATSLRTHLKTRKPFLNAKVCTVANEKESAFRIKCTQCDVKDLTTPADLEEHFYNAHRDNAKDIEREISKMYHRMHICRITGDFLPGARVRVDGSKLGAVIKKRADGNYRVLYDTESIDDAFASSA